MKLGEYVKSYRTLNGLSQRDFAKLAGLTSGYISMLENNKNPQTGKAPIPKIDTYVGIARATGHTLDELLAIVDDKVNLGKEDTEPSLLPQRAVRVAQLYNIADARDQKIVDTVLDPYEKKLPDDNAVIPLPISPKSKVNTKVKRRKDGFVELSVYEDQLPAAGYSSYFDTPRSHIEQYPANLIPDHTNFGVPVGGNSMEPKLANHATAFIQSTPRIESGEIGLFSLNGEPYIKQLIVDEKKREVRLHSANPIYEDIVVHEFDDLRVFGRVLGGYPEYRKTDTKA